MKRSVSPGLDAVGRLLAAMDLSCCDGCRDCSSRCAGPVPMTLDEYQAICAFLGTVGDPQSGTTTHDGATRSDAGAGQEAWDTPCRFHDATAGLCRVYPVRPLVCRMMGHVPWLPCPVNRVSDLPDLTLVQQGLDEYCRYARKPYYAWAAMQAKES